MATKKVSAVLGKQGFPSARFYFELGEDDVVRVWTREHSYGGFTRYGTDLGRDWVRTFAKDNDITIISW